MYGASWDSPKHTDHNPLKLSDSRVHDDECLPELDESKDQYESKREENNKVRDEPNEGATWMMKEKMAWKHHHPVVTPMGTGNMHREDEKWRLI
jgi:hypothetical protein